MEKQLEALNIDDSLESDRESSPRMIRTFSLPSNQNYFFKASEKLKSPMLDRHYNSEQMLCPNIYSRETSVILSEMQTRIKQTEYAFYDQNKVAEHFWHSRINKASPISTFVPSDDQVEYMEIEKYPEIEHSRDTMSSASLSMLAVNKGKTMDKLVDSMNPAECMNSTKSICKKPLPFADVISQSPKNMLMCPPNLRKLKRTCKIKKSNPDNADYTNESNENDKKQNNYDDMKKEICSKNVSKRSKVKQAFYICFIAIFLTFVLSFLIPLHDDENDKHSNTFATAIIELEKQIFGQDQAIKVLTEYLQQDSPFLKVIALVGGTGVGKSYTVQIIKKNFHDRHNHVFFSRADLFVLENLREEHSLDVINFVKNHQEKCSNRYCTIFAIFNVEQMNDDLIRNIDLNKSINAIKNTFAGANFDIKIIPYESLSEDALEKCIVNTEKDIGITLSQDQIALIKRQLIENNIGCKRVYGKVQVIGRQ